jgi:hypothetical protein
VLALAAALAVAVAGWWPVAPALVGIAAVRGWAAWRAGRRAERYRVGAQSEREVREVLKLLAADGWEVRQSVPWPGRGDVDHVLRAPCGRGFAVETKTRHWTQAHAQRTAAAARWLACRRRRFPRGVMPVLCVVRGCEQPRCEGGVLVVAVADLIGVLRSLAGSDSARGGSIVGR